MSKVTIDEIKKMMETEKDMTSVMDATSRMMKKNFEALEKQNAISEKQLKVMEEHTEVLKRNSEVMEKYMDLMEKQFTQGKRRSERIRSRSPSGSSASSDIVEIPLPPPLPLPPTPEPIVKKPKIENVESRWAPPPNGTVSPWMNPPKIISLPSPISLNQLPAKLDYHQSSNASRRQVQSLLQSFHNPFQKSIRGCMYCGETEYKHISEMCPVLRDSVSRTAFMKMNYLCLTCAEPVYRCPDPIKCRFVSRKCDHCVGQHLNALCNVRYPASTPFRFD